MIAGEPAASVALQELPVLLHKAIDPFRVDRVLAGGSPLALEERGDPPVAIGWPLVDEATDIGGQFDIAGPDLWSPCRASSLLTFDDIGSGNI
jgi:hypothetical protein